MNRRHLGVRSASFSDRLHGQRHRIQNAIRTTHRIVFSILYMLAFALVLSLIGYDLVMGTDPHWYSTLFGAYTFVKAIYIGFGALIILTSILHSEPE